MTVTIFDVAKYFLSQVAVEKGSAITHLKLQKLCYYAQAWYLAIEEKKLFEEHFEAWVHGPVNPELFNVYREFGYNLIPAPENFDYSVFTIEQLEHLEEIWDIYGKYDAKFLEELTHEEDPWLDAREGYDPSERCDVEIKPKTMMEYYSEQLED